MSFAINTAVAFAGTFTDPGTLDTHTATWQFDTTTVSSGVVVTEPSNGNPGTVSLNYTFTAAGVYDVKLTVADRDGGSTTASTIAGVTARVVIYDPSVGFVTGGGWIDPASGRANFGLVSQYKKGSSVPTGETQYQAPSLNFHSTSYDWLVVTAPKSQYQGTGTINGSGTYGFIVTTIDGQYNGGTGPDLFRIRIWDKSTGETVHDTQPGDPDGAEPTNRLAGAISSYI